MIFSVFDGSRAHITSLARIFSSDRISPTASFVAIVVTTVHEVQNCFELRSLFESMSILLRLS